MTSFLGEYECKVDDKGRVLIPAALKKQISADAQEKFVVNRGFEKHLTLYPMNEWNIISATVNKLNLFEKKNRLFVRMFHNGATELEMDNASRILLPKTLCKDVLIEKEVILFAYSNRIEIWAKKEYENMLKDESVDFASLAEEVMGNTNKSDSSNGVS